MDQNAVQRQPKEDEEAADEATSEDQSQVEKQSGIEWSRLPRPALEVIYSYLDTPDIKNCRLVSKHWSRFALDKISFVASIQHLGPGEQAPASMDQHRYRINVTPVIDIAEHSITPLLRQLAVKQHTDNPAAETLNLDEMPVAFEAFNRKIKGFILNIAKPLTIAVLSRLGEILTTARGAVIGTGKGEEFHTWAAFERVTTPANDIERPMKCRQLAIRSSDDDDNDIAPVISQLLTNDACFLETINLIDWDWFGLHRLIEDFEHNSDNGNPLTFERCDVLLFDEVSREVPAASLGNSLGRFPVLRQLECAIGLNDSADDIVKGLEQLASLKSLTIFTDAANLPQQSLPKLRLPGLEELCLCRNVILPNSPQQFASAGLKTLRFGAQIENMQRLADRAQLGGGNLSNLTTLDLLGLEPDLVEPHLRTILRAASKLTTFTAATDYLREDEVAVFSTIYNIVADVAPGLATMQVGVFNISDGFENCRGLVQQLVDAVKQRSLKTAISVDFKDNAAKSMLSAMAEVGVGGDDVTASRLDDAKEPQNDNEDVYELAWHSNVAGNQQKLKIRVQKCDEENAAETE